MNSYRKHSRFHYLIRTLLALLLVFACDPSQATADQTKDKSMCLNSNPLPAGYGNVYGARLNLQQVKQIYNTLKPIHQTVRLNVFECDPHYKAVTAQAINEPQFRWQFGGCHDKTNRVEVFNNPYSIVPLASYPFVNGKLSLCPAKVSLTKKINLIDKIPTSYPSYPLSYYLIQPLAHNAPVQLVVVANVINVQLHSLLKSLNLAVVSDRFESLLITNKRNSFRDESLTLFDQLLFLNQSDIPQTRIFIRKHKVILFNRAIDKHADYRLLTNELLGIITIKEQIL